MDASPSPGDSARSSTRGPAVGLFASQQIRMVEGPLFVGEDSEIEREIVALSESRRTETYWVKASIRSASSGTLAAEMILAHATLKHSYAKCEEELAELG